MTSPYLTQPVRTEVEARGDVLRSAIDRALVQLGSAEDELSRLLDTPSICRILGHIARARRELIDSLKR